MVNMVLCLSPIFSLFYHIIVSSSMSLQELKAAIRDVLP